MRSRIQDTLAVAALACALPALAQTASSSVSVTTTNTGQASASLNVTNGNTRITGGTGQGTVSSSGVVVDAGADQQLLSQVVSDLASDPALDGASIDVQVVGGRVTLNGMTPGIAQAERAKEIAQRAAGAANVASNLATGRQ